MTQDNSGRRISDAHFAHCVEQALDAVEYVQARAEERMDQDGEPSGPWGSNREQNTRLYAADDTGTGTASGNIPAVAGAIGATVYAQCTGGVEVDAPDTPPHHNSSRENSNGPGDRDLPR